MLTNELINDYFICHYKAFLKSKKTKGYDNFEWDELNKKLIQIIKNNYYSKNTTLQHTSVSFTDINSLNAYNEQTVINPKFTSNEHNLSFDFIEKKIIKQKLILTCVQFLSCEKISS